MAAITSTTESWNSHKFSEVETHIKGNYTPVGGSDMSHAKETITWGTLTGTSYTPLWQIRSPYIGSDYGCAYLCGSASDIPGCGGTAISMQIDGYFYQKGGNYRVADTSDLAGYSTTSHTHSNYSLTSHTHDYSNTYAAKSHTHSYLPLSGGTIQNGSVSYPFNINSTDSNVWMYFQVGGSNKASVGYWNGIAFLANEYGNHPRIGILDDGTVIYRPSSSSETYYKVHHDGIGAKFGGSLEVFSDGSSWCEGIRVHPSSNEWSGIVFCEKSNSGGTGTSSKTWSIHNHEGEFAIALSGSHESNSVSYIVNTDRATWKFKTNITATGGITALSDSRHKKVIDNTTLTVKQIADMPSVLFKWTDGEHDDKTYVGTLAQSWKSVLPEVVLEADNEEKTLSFNYGVAALVSSITTARKVVDHEKEIKALKAKINVLEERISELEG